MVDHHEPETASQSGHGSLPMPSKTGRFRIILDGHLDAMDWLLSCVRESVSHDYESCIYVQGAKKCFVRRTKTGFSAHFSGDTDRPAQPLQPEGKDE